MPTGQLFLSAGEKNNINTKFYVSKNSESDQHIVWVDLFVLRAYNELLSAKLRMIALGRPMYCRWQHEK